MGFRLQRTACFAQGAWNIYILQPDWLNRKQVWSVSGSLLIEALRTGPGFRYSAEDGSVRWTVTPFRVTVETQSGSENIGKPLARLLRVLPETPITSVGSQFVYRGNEADILAALPAVNSLAQTEPVLGRGASLLVQATGVRYALELVSRAENQKVDLSILAMPTIPDECANSELATRVEKFEEHRQTAMRLAKQYWKADFDVDAET